MTRLFSPGYLLPAPGRISMTQSTVLSRGVPQSSNVIPDWDYSADVAVEVELAVDLTGVSSDIDAQHGLRLVAAIHWTASGTGLRGAGPSVEVTDGSNTVRVTLDGARLGGILTVSPRVVFMSAAVSGPLAPQRAGATMWSGRFTVVLEGGGVRFPTIPVPFSQTGIGGGGGGAWALDVRTSDLAASVSSAISLYLNSEHPTIAEMLANPAVDESGLILRFIEYDVTRQLLHVALTAQDLDDTVTQEPGTLGEALVNVIRRLYPARSLAELQGAMTASPGELEAELQSVLDLPLPSKR